MYLVRALFSAHHRFAGFGVHTTGFCVPFFVFVFHIPTRILYFLNLTVIPKRNKAVG